jgi:hypothetical protein
VVFDLHVIIEGCFLGNIMTRNYLNQILQVSNTIQNKAKKSNNLIRQTMVRTNLLFFGLFLIASCTKSIDKKSGGFNNTPSGDSEIERPEDYNYNSDSPVIFFSDLTSAPNSGWNGSSEKGGAVTIWGLGFGSERGDSFVTCGGVNLLSEEDYAEWGRSENNAKVHAGLTQQRISFWLNSNMPIGNTTISITVNGKSSAPIDFTIRDLGTNHIFFIDKVNGSNANSGLSDNVSNSNGPWKDFCFADPQTNSAVNPEGDIVYIRSGIYNTLDVGPGSSDGMLIKNYGGVSGSVERPMVIAGYPGDSYPILTLPVIRPAAPHENGANLDNWIFSKLRYQGEQKSIFFLHGDGWRLVGIYFNLTQPQAVFKSATISGFDIENHYYLGLVFEGGGFDYYAHHIYPNCTYGGSPGGNNRNIHVAFNEVTNFQGNQAPNYGGAAFNFRSGGTGFTVEDVYIYNNYMHDSEYGQFFYAGENGGSSNFYLFNNVVTKSNMYGSDSAKSLLFVGFGNNGGQFYAYNNTFYESGGAGSVVTAYNILDWHLKNNIIYESVGKKYQATGDARIFSDFDCMYGSGLEPTGEQYNITNKITSDPLFESIENEIFSLTDDSPCKDRGTDDVSANVTKDMYGAPRPLGLGYDIGAFEKPE